MEADKSQKSNGDFLPLEIDFKYRIACQFMKEMKEKAFHFGFDDQQKLQALKLQADIGPLDPKSCQAPGLFDFVGKARRAHWLALGNMPKDNAKEEFVSLLDKFCPHFGPYFEAQSILLKDQNCCISMNNNFRSSPPSDPCNFLQTQPVLNDLNQLVACKFNQDDDIKKALNSQTIEQFSKYAQEQFPNDSEKQNELISQLQDRHFHQYMAYLCQMRLIMSETNKQISENSQEMTEEKHNMTSVSSNQQPTLPSNPPNNVLETHELSNGEVRKPSKVHVPSIWTRSEHKEFIESSKNENESVVQISCGEILKIRVPTSASGNSIVWEFATDNYDIGFGLSFEHEISKDSQVADLDKLKENIEDGIELIPVSRQKSDSEVYCGSHLYPGHGTYILKFDNSYSIWRSKTLYYKVYYSKPGDDKISLRIKPHENS